MIECVSGTLEQTLACKDDRGSFFVISEMRRRRMSGGGRTVSEKSTSGGGTSWWVQDTRKIKEGRILFASFTCL